MTDTPTDPRAVPVPAEVNHAMIERTDARHRRANRAELVNALADVLSSYSCENASNTPAHVLADHLTRCLEDFEDAVRRRATWYGRMDVPGAGQVPYPFASTEAGR